MKGEISDSDGHGPLDSDELFYALSNAGRRTVLFHLRQHRVATLDELVDVLTAASTKEGSADDNTHVHSSLLHSHLPLLEDRGLLTYDPDEQIVESTSLHGTVGAWLDLAVRQQLQYERTVDADARTDDEGIAVLLVDDEPGLPETIGGYIERENDDIEVTTAASTLEAVSTLEEASFDCVVSDYQMPAISGLDFLKAVREQDVDLPFIVFTAKGSERVASEAIATGVTDYVQKDPDPEQFDVLVERIRKAVTSG
ncbi:response regulator [Natrarchaeobaculum sulfurireducens]|uniref:Rec domain n=1 Tax=Natrarchaeobaculum sulfurireducens TaxID=2044521 RepID=A0A346PNI3_9EURY|nr:response regulator [Natrarchaeobaculum sulfurireducens]AXR78876.1 Rec domain [Natrarchaeobaculum sulfurireducens]AXR81078.1 response regulator [Natrarchaeobaculum sulfurireducens]